MKAGLRAAERFRGRRFLYGYAKGKIAWDPAYRVVAEKLRGGVLPVLDVGCGIGLLASFLREFGCGQPILGIEPDQNKLAMARERVACAYPDLDFQCGDARSLPAFSGDVILMDILHYLEPACQQEVLLSAAERVAPGGRLIVRTTFCDGSWRYRATVMEEVLIRTIGWIRAPGCHFPRPEDIVGCLQKTGWAVDVAPMWGRTPFNSYMVEVCRPAGCYAK